MPNIQLAHAGRKGSAQISLDDGKPPAADENPWTTPAPSAIHFGPGWHVPQTLSREGLAAIRAQFVAATERAARIGFDLAELQVPTAICYTSFFRPSAISAMTSTAAR